MTALADHIPSFSAQGVLHTDIPNETLSGNYVKFNGSIIDWEGRRLMGYRRYDLKHGRTNLAISELGADWMPTGNHWIPSFPTPLGNERFEDVRLFIHKDRLWMSCSEVYDKANSKYWRCNQRCYRLDKNFNPDRDLKIQVGRNFVETEKNWMFFSSGDQLYFIYDITNAHVYRVNDETGAVLGKWEGQRFKWPFGHMRGGTAPIRLADNTFLTFIHSSTDSASNHQWLKRRYSMSAATFSATEPFQVLTLSREPILYGTRHEPYCGSGNSTCIFPSGIIHDGPAWHVSCGVNDTLSTVLHLHQDQIFKNMVAAGEFYRDPRTFWLTSHPRAILCTAAPEYDWQHGLMSKRRRNTHLWSTADVFAIRDLRSDPRMEEITAKEYEELMPKQIRSSVLVNRADIAKMYESPAGTKTGKIFPGTTRILPGQNQPPTSKAIATVKY